MKILDLLCRLSKSDDLWFQSRLLKKMIDPTLRAEEAAQNIDSFFCILEVASLVRLHFPPHGHLLLAQ